MKNLRGFFSVLLATLSLVMGCGPNEVRPHCNDQLKNGAETGVDCGGDCNACADGSSCMVPEDCESLLCIGGQCQAPSCADGIKNGAESDVDCGLEGCPPCDEGKACSDGTQCESLVCEGNQCLAATCTDGETNGGETSLNCGGPCLCKEGDPCESQADCESSVCNENVCAAPACDDGVWNGDESDIDCGGPDCLPCDIGYVCDMPSDCASGVCVGGLCQAPACDDSVVNGTETDVDCGGPGCPPCADGLMCAQDSDNCQSEVCDQGICLAPTCDDQVQNGAESDVDCGDLACPCANDRVCATNDNCASHACVGGTCSVWSVQAGGGNGNFGTGVTLDSAGNVYTVGWLDGKGRVAKYQPDGTLQDQWLTTAGQNQFNKVEILAAATLQKGVNEYIIVAGRYRGVGIGFPGCPALPSLDTAFYDGFLAALDTNGTCQWQRALLSSGVDGDDSIDAVAINSNEQIVWTGTFRSEHVLYQGSIGLTLDNVGTADVIVGSTNFDGGGEHNWSVSFGGPGTDRGLGIALDSNDIPVVVGLCSSGTSLVTTNGLVDCTQGAVGDGAYNGYVAKLNPSHGIHWAGVRSNAGLGAFHTRAVVVRTVNGVNEYFAAGRYSGGAASIARYDDASSGAQLDEVAVGDENTGTVLALAPGKNALVMATAFKAPLTVQSNGLPGGGISFSDDFLTYHVLLTWHDYDALSNISQAAAFGQNGDVCIGDYFNGGDAPTGLAIDPSTDAVLVSGSFMGSVDFGAGPLVASGGQADAFLTNLGVMPMSTAE